MHKIRSQYPILGKYTYLDTAYHGLFSMELIEWQRALSMHMHHEASLFTEYRVEFLNEVRITLSTAFYSQWHQTYLLPNFSFGMNTLLDILPEKSRVLILDEDYPSIINAVLLRDFKLHRIVISENLESQILEAFSKFKPDYFCFSMVQYISGFKLSLEFIRELKSTFPNVKLITDATQYLGVEEFRFCESGIDIIIASCYKWLHAGDGCAVIFIADEMHELLEQLLNGKMRSLKDIMEPGHLSMVNMGVLKKAIEVHQAIGFYAIEKQIKGLSTKAKELLLERKLITPWLEYREHSNIFNINGDKKLFYNFRSKGIITSLRGNGIRVSFAHYNNQRDIKTLIENLYNHDT